LTGQTSTQSVYLHLMHGSATMYAIELPFEPSRACLSARPGGARPQPRSAQPMMP
jgi:hypothetical protein